MIRFLSRRSALLSLVATALLLASVPARAEHERGTLRYLAVGVSDYANGNNLRFAHRDAIELGKYWSQQKGRLYRDVEGRTLINQDATRANLASGLDQLALHAQPGDTVIVSLAGHAGAVGPRLTQWAFCPYDFDSRDDLATCLTGKFVRDKLAAMVRQGTTVVLILDSCFAGAIDVEDSGIVLFASSLAHQTSAENGRLGHGMFTKAFLEAIQGKADNDRDGFVSLAEIEAYVAIRVAELSDEGGNSFGRPSEQHPTFARPLAIRANLPLVNCWIYSGAMSGNSSTGFARSRDRTTWNCTVSR
jgi:hypothetical protein